MTYSCTDMADDLLNALNVTIPDEADDNPSMQADIAMAEIERLQRIETAALERPTPASALVSTIGRMTPYAGDNVDTLDAVETVNSLIAAALALPAAPAPEAVWLDRATVLLTDTLSKWEDEEESVKEEKADHIDALKAFFAEFSVAALLPAVPVAPAAFDAAALSDDDLCRCLEAMRKRGWAVAAYDVAALGEGPCQDENGDYDEESVGGYLEENREALEEIMCNAIWEHVSGDYQAPGAEADDEEDTPAAV
jgi:hypothetical protein